MSPSFSRRGLFKVGALALTAGAIGAAVPNAAALGPIRGTITITLPVSLPRRRLKRPAIWVRFGTSPTNAQTQRGWPASR